MGERGFAIKADTTKAAWESDEFPQLCETCLGENPYVRMMKESYGSACKICTRPFTVFRWKPGKRARYKKTEVCQTCARMKNVCQTCVLDLQYNLPVQVRDAFLAKEGGAAAQQLVNVPESDANREWFAQQHSRMLEQDGAVSAYGKATGSNSALLRMARREPYYKRNRAHLCSFFARGECNRGDECPYLHEMPRDKDDPLAKQNIKDRFYGKNDPVALKMMGSNAQKKHRGHRDAKRDGSGNDTSKARGPTAPSSTSTDSTPKPKPPPLPPGKKPPLPPGPPPTAAQETKGE